MANEPQKTYLVFEIEVTNHEGYEAYRTEARKALDEIGGGGRLLIRGGTLFPNAITETIEGDWMPQRFVVVEFPSREAAQEYYFSDTYQRVLKMRQASSNARALMITPEPEDA